MTNEDFQKLQQDTPVATTGFTGKVYRCDYDEGKVQITVQTPLRRRGQRSRVKFQNVTILKD